MGTSRTKGDLFRMYWLVQLSVLGDAISFHFLKSFTKYGRTHFHKMSQYYIVSPNKLKMLATLQTSSIHVSKSNPITGLDRPRRFQDVEAPRFQDNQHMKVVRLSALHPGNLYPPPPQKIFLVLISVRD
jgi:hypothetical protein